MMVLIAVLLALILLTMWIGLDRIGELTSNLIVGVSGLLLVCGLVWCVFQLATADLGTVAFCLVYFLGFVAVVWRAEKKERKRMHSAPTLLASHFETLSLR